MRKASVFLTIAYVCCSVLFVQSNLLASVNNSILLNAIEIVNRRFLYSDESPCSTRSLGSRKFQFKGGYISDHPDKFHLLQQYEAVRIVHYCPLISNLIDSHLRVQRSASHDCKHKAFEKSTNISLVKVPKKLPFAVSDRRVFRATSFVEKLCRTRTGIYVSRQVSLNSFAISN